ncbi:MAG: hypothetical protein JSU87_04650 [Gemmatimonadota bacterium]|nr:MAG: hypothetical protein JSU87_04650 [Gemmatimonadota bacterium]
MNKHWVLALAAAVLLSACSRSTQLAVRSVTGTEDEQDVPRAQQVITLLPYDRDSIFSALTAQASEPEPQPPAALLALRDSVSAAQELWRDSESGWNEMRSELQVLSERMQAMSRTSDEYFQLYERFDNLDSQVRRLDREKQGYFEAFTALQSSYNEVADSFNAVLTAWEDGAFFRYGEVIDSLTEVLGEAREDTTDAYGWAYFSLPRGQWWLHTRAELVFEELYWNLPYMSAGGTDTVVLNDANAEVRPLFK